MSRGFFKAFTTATDVEAHALEEIWTSVNSFLTVYHEQKAWMPVLSVLITDHSGRILLFEGEDGIWRIPETCIPKGIDVRECGRAYARNVLDLSSDQTAEFAPIPLHHGEWPFDQFWPASQGFTTGVHRTCVGVMLNRPPQQHQSKFWAPAGAVHRLLTKQPAHPSCTDVRLLGKEFYWPAIVHLEQIRRL